MSKIGTSPTRDASRADAERDAFIAEHFGLMSYREMGEALGCSRTTVYRRAKALGLTEATAREQVRVALDRIESAPEAPENDQLRRLFELRDLLHACITSGDISMQALTSMSREYRETLRQIADLQRGEAPSEAGASDVAGPMADLLAAMPDLSALAAAPADG